ncbi:MAG TPA: hypothetical protein PL089_15365 [Ignavibacteria bacterium]|nr:hypothetical protein [Ignavibacteria bacterium]
METIITIQSVTAILIGIAVYFAKRFINDQDKRWEEQESFRGTTNEKISEIEVNYLDRFKEVGHKIVESERIIRDKLVESERNIINKILELKNYR